MGAAVILRNVAANAVGMAVSVLVQATMMIAAYRLAGPEQYGLIGVFGALLTAAAVLDIGLGQTVVRELARRRDVAEAASQGAVLFTFQALYAAIVAGLTASLVAAAPLMARLWLKPARMPIAEVEGALVLMGVAVGVQRLRGLYQSALDGLERQVLSNGLVMVANLLRLTLGLGALIGVAPTASAYFAGQVLASGIETGLFAIMAWRAVPPPAASPRRFDRALAGEAAAFAGTNAAAAALGTAIQVGDAVIVSAVMPLPIFGSYALVAQICALTLRLATPVLAAMLPRLSLYVRAGRRRAAARLVFTAGHAIAAMLASSVGVLTAFGPALLLALTARPVVAQALAPVMALLAAAYALNGLSRTPHGLQLAEGDPATALRVNLILAGLYLPLAAVLTPRFGVATPAALLLIGNALAFPVFVSRAFKRPLRPLRRAWVKESVIWPVLAAGGVCTLARLVVPAQAELGPQIAAACATWVLATVAGSFTPSRHRYHLPPWPRPLRTPAPDRDPR